MPINKPEDFQKAPLLTVIWWLLWVSAIVLLEFYYRDLSGERVKVSQGQYWFFGISVLSTLGLAIYLKKSLLDSFLLSKMLAFGLGWLFLALGLSSVFGINAGYGVRLLVILVITASPFVLLGVLSQLIANKSKLLPLLAVSSFCAFTACILAVTGPLSWLDVTLENYLMGGGRFDRWAFLFIEANGLAGMMALGITVTLYQIHIVQSVLTKYGLGLLVLPIIFFVFWKTNSRGSILWVIVTLLFYCGLWLRNYLSQFNNFDFKRFVFPVLAIIIILGALVLLNYGQELFVYLRLDQADLTTGRLEIWLMYLEQFKSHPLLGFGFGASDQIMADYIVQGKYKISGPLNVFFGILGETGFLGFSALLFLWVGAILKTWQVVKIKLDSQDEYFHFAFFLMVILISLAAHQNGEWQVLRITPFNFLFFFLLSAAWSLPGHVETQSTKTTDPI